MSHASESPDDNTQVLNDLKLQAQKHAEASVQAQAELEQAQRAVELALHRQEAMELEEAARKAEEELQIYEAELYAKKKRMSFTTQLQKKINSFRDTSNSIISTSDSDSKHEQTVLSEADQFPILRHGAVVSLQSRASGRHLRINSDDMTVDGNGDDVNDYACKFIIHRIGKTIKLQSRDNQINWIAISRQTGQVGVVQTQTPDDPTSSDNEDCNLLIQSVILKPYFCFKSEPRGHLGVLPNGMMKNAFKTLKGKHARFHVKNWNVEQAEGIKEEEEEHADM